MKPPFLIQGVFGILGGIGADHENRRRPRGVTTTRHLLVRQTQRTYHRRRRQRVLGKLTPIALEAIMTTQAASAA